MTLQSLHRRRSGRIAFLALIILASVPARIFALSPQDLVIVYNHNLPDSLAVASYYAKSEGCRRTTWWALTSRFPRYCGKTTRGNWSPP